MCESLIYVSVLFVWPNFSLSPRVLRSTGLPLNESIIIIKVDRIVETEIVQFNYKQRQLVARSFVGSNCQPLQWDPSTRYGCKNLRKIANALQVHHRRYKDVSTILLFIWEHFGNGKRRRCIGRPIKAI